MQASAKKGFWILGIFFLIPFIMFGLGFKMAHFVAGLIFALYLSLLIINFEAGFLCLIFIRSSVDYLKNFSGSVNLAAAISLVIIVLGVFYVLYRKVNILKYEDVGIFLIFLAVCGASVAYSHYPEESISDWLRLVSTFSVYLLTRIIFSTKEKIRTLFVVILISALLPILLAYYQLVTGKGTVMDSGSARIVGTFLHPNAFASYLLILLIFCTAQVLEKTQFISRPFLIAMTGATFIIFIFTFSRGAWIVFVLAMFLLGLLRYRKLLALLPFVLVGAVAAVPGIRHRILNTFDPGYTHGRSGWDWRLDTWREISVMVEKKPLLGHGLSSVENEFGILAHNDYLRLLAEIGIVGLGIYIIFSIFLLYQSWADYKNVRSDLAKSFQIGLIVMIIAFLVRQFADNTLRNTVMMIYFWIFVAIARNMARLYSRKNYLTRDNRYEG